MPTALARLKDTLETHGIAPALLAEAEQEHAELAHKADELELLLITIVRTGWPWDEEGEPTVIHSAVKDGYTTAMVAARNLLGLNLNTMITRTEPKT
jgi:hypothetical protein